MKKSILLSSLFCLLSCLVFAQPVASSTVAVATSDDKNNLELLNEQHSLDEVSINDIYIMTEFGFVTEAEYERLKREQAEANRKSAQEKAAADALAEADAQAARKAAIEAQAMKDANFQLSLLEETKGYGSNTNQDIRVPANPNSSLENAADRSITFSTKRIYNSVEPIPVKSTGRKPMSANRAHRLKLKRIGKR